jgi:hypothetical protein
MDSQRILKLTISLMLLGSAFSLPLYSQTPATTIGELYSNRVLEERETLEITEENGMKYRAKVTAITERTITVVNRGTARTLTDTQLREIRHGRRDSSLNGTLIGLGTGFGAGLLAVSLTCGSNGSECSRIANTVFLPTFAAGGAAIGALIDSLTRKQETIFSRSNSRQTHIAPIVGKKMAGVQVSLRF